MSQGADWDMTAYLKLSEYIRGPFQYKPSTWPPDRIPGRQRIVFDDCPFVVDVEYISPAVVDLWFIERYRRRRVRWINRTFPFLPADGPAVHANSKEQTADTLRAAGMMEREF